MSGRMIHGPAAALVFRARLALVGLVALTLALAVGCQPAAGGPSTPPPGAVYVSANQLIFEQPSVEAPAGEAFPLYFENREAVPHNVHVVDATGASIARGEVFSGPAAQTLDVPALTPGTYRLLCDVHPDMTAQLVTAAD